MARKNERCIEYTGKELAIEDREIAPGETIKSRQYDLHGAKIHVMWLKATAPGLEATFEYQTEKYDVLQISEMIPVEHTPKEWCRVQFATYGKSGRPSPGETMQLPAPFMMMKIHNPTNDPIRLRAYGVSQLQ